MVDVTSTKLQIVDQTNGGNNNTWGDILDANQAKLENAIANQATIAGLTGGTVVLTEDQQRDSFIELTGSLTSNLTLQVSSIKRFIFHNNTTGAFTVTVEVSGGSGVTIAQGEMAMVRSDGTNCNEIIFVNSDYLLKAGDTMSGELAMGTNKITGVGDPTAAQDAATRNYVDTYKVEVAATVTGATYNVAAADLDKLIPLDPTSNAITVNLLAAATAGDGFRVGFIALNITNTLTIDGSTTETINGALTDTIDNAYDVHWYRCDGSNWYLESGFQPGHEARIAAVEGASTAQSTVIFISSVTGDAATGTGVMTWRWPVAATLDAIRGFCHEAPTGANAIVDVNLTGTGTIMTTNKITIEDGEKTTESATTKPALTTTSFSKDDELTFDIDQVGSTTEGKGYAVILEYTPT